MSEIQDVSNVQATYVAAQAATIGYLQPHTNRRRIVLMAVTAPANSKLSIFRGYNASGSGSPINTIFPADGRTYDNTREGAPMTVWPGEALTFRLTGGNAATAGAVARITVTSSVDL